MTLLNRHFIIQLPRKVLRRCRRIAGRVVRRFIPRPRQLVFIFGGRTEYWPGMGSELYQKEEVFRKSVHESEAFVKELSGRSVLANFENATPPDFYSEEFNVAFTIAVLQIALFDLWKSRGVYPNATLGISLGEVMAVYAAGGLSRRDALTIVAGYAFFVCRDASESRVIYAQVNLETAFDLAAEAPVWIEPIFETAEKGMLFFCDPHDISAAVKFFSEKGVSAHAPHDYKARPYHTSRMKVYKEGLNEFYKDIQPQPLGCPVYSCVLGDVWPKGSLIDNNYWQELTVMPVRNHAAMRAAIQDGHTVFIQAGPHPFTASESKQGAKSSLLLLNSMQRNVPEREQFEKTRSQLRRRQPSSLQMQVASWPGEFRFSHTHVARDPYPYFRALRAGGPIQYLPAEASWLVLDYNLIDEVLKQPQVFSSRLHQPFDALLLGSDPPAHTTMRALLQPLFSPPALSALGSFTEKEATRLTAQLSQHPSFDLVEEFSMPLAQSVIAHFLGMDKEAEAELKACLGGPVYGLAYLQRLEDFCRQYLQTAKPADGAAALLLRLVEEGSLNFDDAVRLLRMLWIAGMTTTSMLLSQSIYQLLKHPHLITQIQSDPSLLHKFIEECLRIEAPESELRRIVTQPTELGGQKIPEGAIVMLALRAANRDERYFEDPDTIRLDRPAGKHLSFGGGYHYCLGVGMARTEAREALKVILPLLEQWQLDNGSPAAYFPSPHFRGLARLKLRRQPISKPIPAA